MFRQLAKYGTGLIALYIVVANATNMGALFGPVSDGVSKVTKTLQGRS